MPATPTSSVAHAHFGDFDALAEAIQGWDLDWTQLDAGPLRAELLQATSSSALFTRAGFDRQFHQRGGAPAGARTFAFFDRVDEISWCGHRANREMLMAFGADGFEAVSPPGFVAYTLSFPLSHLESVAQLVRGEDLGKALSADGNAFVSAPAELAALGPRVAQWSDALRATSSGTLSSALLHELDFELPAQVLQALESSSPPPLPSNQVRATAVRRALEVIDAHRTEPLRVRDLCSLAGVSWRTLDYAFRERFDTTPKRYLQAFRLNGVRRELRDASSHTRVADVANRWGFWHMGQFAADYRRMFAELPSETLHSKRGADPTSPGSDAATS